MAVSRREANKIKCRQDILKASRRLFKEKGYENTMIDDVADKAEISKATLYNYFPNKESLLVGTMDDQIAAAEKYIRESGKEENLCSYDKLKLALEFLILDSIPFIDVSRRIMYLNACEASPMYGKVNSLNASVAAAIKKNTQMALGNIIGSNIFNILFVLGIAGLILPIPFNPAFWFDTLVALLAVVLLWLFTVRHHRLNRGAGVVFVVIYLAYLVMLIAGK